MKRATSLLLSLILITLMSATAAYAGKGGQAAVSLSNASAALSQTSDTARKLEKAGALNSSTVTWTITVTQGTTVSGHLFINGFLTGVGKSVFVTPLEMVEECVEFNPDQQPVHAHVAHRLAADSGPLTGRPAGPIRAPSGRLAQRESTPFTRVGS